MLYQFGLECIKKVHFNQSEMCRMFLFVVVVFGKQQYSRRSSIAVCMYVMYGHHI